MAGRWNWAAAAALAIGALGALPAQGADMALRGSMPAYEPTGPNFGGIYLGGFAGVGNTSMDARSAARSAATRSLSGLIFLNPPSGGTPAPDLIDNDPIRVNPPVFGGFVGYQAQFEDAVIGFEIDYTRVGGRGGTSDWTQPYSLLYASDSFTDAFSQSALVQARLQDYMTFRGRAGWVVGRFMPFATAGFVLARGDVSTTYTAGFSRIDTQPGDGVDWTRPYGTITGAPPTNTRAVRNATGWGLAAGLGIDALVTDNIFLRGEYQYVRVNSMGGIALTMHTIRAGVGIKY